MKRQKLYIEFTTKREFVNWVNENANEIDFFEDVVRVEYYPKEEEENDD